MRYINQLKNEEVVIEETFFYENVEYKVLITKDLKPDSNKELYFNVYVTNEYFKEDSSNNLYEQIPQESFNESDFNKLFCELRCLEFYLWFKYSTNEDVLSFSIETFKN